MGAWLSLLGVRAQVRGSLACVIASQYGMVLKGGGASAGLGFILLPFLGSVHWASGFLGGSWLSLPHGLSWGPCTGSRFMASCSAGILPTLLQLILSVVKVGRGLRWPWVSLPHGPSSPWFPPPHGSRTQYPCQSKGSVCSYCSLQGPLLSLNLSLSLWCMCVFA